MIHVSYMSIIDCDNVAAFVIKSLTIIKAWAPPDLVDCDHISFHTIPKSMSVEIGIKTCLNCS